MANSEPGLDTYAHYHSNLPAYKLSDKYRKMISLAVSLSNDCTYCAALHTSTAVDGAILTKEERMAARGRWGNRFPAHETSRWLQWDICMRPNKTTIVYQPMEPGETTDAAHLVLTIFSEFVAPTYSEEGIAEFKKFVCADDLADRVRKGNIVLLAKSGQRMVGIIEIRENRHIALLFVHRSYQRKGIGKELIQRSIEIIANRNPEIRKITVNSSPNAFAAYERIGFKGVEDEKMVNGIRYIPMELKLIDRRVRHT